MNSKKGMTASALVVVALLAAYGFATGQISGNSAQKFADELFGDSSGGTSSQSSTSVAASPAPGSSQVGGEAELSRAEATDSLSSVEISEEGPTAGYSREDFEHWESAEEYGWSIPSYVADPGSCDARDATLIRDGSSVEVGEYCEVGSGRWADPLTGQNLTDSSGVDVDHVVPLANAYRSGAASWPQEKKAAYANDPLVLAATDDGENQAKGDDGPQAWQPPYEGSHCSYAKRWVQIKAEWDLTVTPAERSALDSMLAGCAA